MSKEIERKFLVTGLFRNLAVSKRVIKQAYLSHDIERTVRIRITNEKAYLTIKGKSDDAGLSRFEWEKEITLPDAEELIKLKTGGIIEKTRYIIPESNGLFFEVDEFQGENYGLIIAEIELSDENQKFIKPEWLGKEVTGNKKYYNSSLSINAYQNW